MQHSFDNEYCSVHLHSHELRLTLTRTLQAKTDKHTLQAKTDKQNCSENQGMVLIFGNNVL